METSAQNSPFIHGNILLLGFFTEKLQRRILLTKGDLFYPQTIDTTVGFIRKGRLKVSLSNEDGDDRLMWFLNENCIISCFRKCFHQEAVALEDTEILIIRKDDFFDAIRSDSKYLEFFLDQLYLKYTYCIETLLIQDKINSKMKIYTLLQQLGKLYGTVQTDNSIHIKNFLTRKDMSSITGIHRSNIIKYISELEHLDIIEKGNHLIIIKQPQLLDKLIETRKE